MPLMLGGRFKITSYRQATSVPSGFMSVSCPQCNKVFARATKFWGLELIENFSSVGLLGIVTVVCSSSSLYLVVKIE